MERSVSHLCLEDLHVTVLRSLWTNVQALEALSAASLGLSSGFRTSGSLEHVAEGQMSFLYAQMMTLQVCSRQTMPVCQCTEMHLFCAFCADGTIAVVVQLTLYGALTVGSRHPLARI